MQRPVLRAHCGAGVGMADVAGHRGIRTRTAGTICPERQRRDAFAALVGRLFHSLLEQGAVREERRDAAENLGGRFGINETAPDLAEHEGPRKGGLSFPLGSCHFLTTSRLNQFHAIRTGPPDRTATDGGFRRHCAAKNKTCG